MKAKGRIDPKELEKLGFSMSKPKEEEDLSYNPSRDVKKSYTALKDPYPSVGKIGYGNHNRASSNIDFGNKGRTDAYRSTNNMSTKNKSL